MTRSTALATALLLAAFPAAAQSLQGASSEGPVLDPAAGLLAEEGLPVSYSGAVTGLPAVTVARPESAIDLTTPVVEAETTFVFVISEPTVALNHLDFGAYEPFAPKRSRQVLKDLAKDKSTNPRANDGVNDVAVNVDGTPGSTKLGTSFVTKTGPVDVKAKAGVVVPGAPAIGEDTQNFVRSTDLRFAMEYKF